MAMTPEQIELEYTHMELDKKASSGTKDFEDEEFDDYDNETEQQDRELTDDTDYEKYFGSAPEKAPSEDDDGYDPEDWEEVE